VTSAVVTPRSDDSQLPELLARTRRHFDVHELSADKAYSTHNNHDVLESFNVAAYIPFKVDAVVNLKFPVWSRLLCEFLLNQERFLPHYHRRSNVETVFSMIKAKFGADVRSRLPVAQVNEVLAKCVAHNLCCVVKAIFTADLAPTFWPDAVATGRSES
jgi:transposase